MKLTFNDYILILLIISTSYFDVKEKRIPNKITLPVILWGLLSSVVFNGFDGFKFSLTGFIAGLGIFMIPYILGGMGAGDVKLMAAIGALKGWEFSLLTALFGALTGGIIVIIYLIPQKKLGISLLKMLGIILVPILKILSYSIDKPFINKPLHFFIDLKVESEKCYVPYGLAIGIGGLLVLFGVGNNLLSFI